MFEALATWLKKWLTKNTLNTKEAAGNVVERNNGAKNLQPSNKLPQEYLDEKDKVRHRLERWALHQDQINSRILTAYLTLEREGHSPITISMLRNRLIDIKTFLSNFNQMKSISPIIMRRSLVSLVRMCAFGMLLRFMYASMKTRFFIRNLGRFKYEDSYHCLQLRKTWACPSISFILYEGLSLFGNSAD